MQPGPGGHSASRMGKGAGTQQTLEPTRDVRPWPHPLRPQAPADPWACGITALFFRVPGPLGCNDAAGGRSPCSSTSTTPSTNQRGPRKQLPAGGRGRRPPAVSRVAPLLLAAGRFLGPGHTHPRGGDTPWLQGDGVEASPKKPFTRKLEENKTDDQGMQEGGRSPRGVVLGAGPGWFSPFREKSGGVHS